MRTEQVRVEQYDPNWPQNFETIRREIEAVLGEFPVAVHHVGSTAVPGMSAKPIIDVDVEIRNRSDFSAVRARLRDAGYLHEGDLGIRDREAFCYAGKPHLQKHHLYVCPSDSLELHRHLTFRDYLRNHPEAVLEYSRAKVEAAKKCANSTDAYMEYKNDCIAQLYEKCGL